MSYIFSCWLSIVQDSFIGLGDFGFQEMLSSTRKKLKVLAVGVIAKDVLIIESSWYVYRPDSKLWYVKTHTHVSSHPILACHHSL